jgi:hypothetical protein
VLFEQVEQPALQPLPTTRYEFAISKSAKINIKWGVPSYGKSIAPHPACPIRALPENSP